MLLGVVGAVDTALVGIERGSSLTLGFLADLMLGTDNMDALEDMVGCGLI